MNIVDKKFIINNKCTEHFISHNASCSGCPLMEYRIKNGHGNCVEVPIDVQYELMISGKGDAYDNFGCV